MSTLMEALAPYVIVSQQKYLVQTRKREPWPNIWTTPSSVIDTKGIGSLIKDESNGNQITILEPIPTAS